jgi:hypothetical protein
MRAAETGFGLVAVALAFLASAHSNAGAIKLHHVKIRALEM